MSHCHETQIYSLAAVGFARHFTGPLAPTGSLASFGFRGEALSAVCASCEVTVATRTADEQAGRLVALDAGGAIVSQRPVARAQGESEHRARGGGRAGGFVEIGGLEGGRYATKGGDGHFIRGS